MLLHERHKASPSKWEPYVFNLPTRFKGVPVAAFGAVEMRGMQDIVLAGKIDQRQVLRRAFGARMDLLPPPHQKVDSCLPTMVLCCSRCTCCVCIPFEHQRNPSGVGKIVARSFRKRIAAQVGFVTRAKPEVQMPRHVGFLKPQKHHL